MSDASVAAPTTKGIPLWLKVSCTLWTAVLVPVYWSVYGPTNFLYFCDVALFLAVIGMWRENKLLVSMPAVGLLLPQFLWVVDFAMELSGSQLIGMTAYMLDPELPGFTRVLSLFHGWFPFVVVYGVYRLGYDRRALWGWTGIALVLIAVCYVFLPAPPAPPGSAMPVNVNFVYGPSHEGPQTWMHPHLWVLCGAGATQAGLARLDLGRTGAGDPLPAAGALQPNQTANLVLAPGHAPGHHRHDQLRRPEPGHGDVARGYLRSCMDQRRQGCTTGSGLL